MNSEPFEVMLWSLQPRVGAVLSGKASAFPMVYLSTKSLCLVGDDECVTQHLTRGTISQNQGYIRASRIPLRVPKGIKESNHFTCLTTWMSPKKQSPVNNDY